MKKIKPWFICFLLLIKHRQNRHTHTHKISKWVTSLKYESPNILHKNQFKSVILFVSPTQNLRCPINMTHTCYSTTQTTVTHTHAHTHLRSQIQPDKRAGVLSVTELFLSLLVPSVPPFLIHLLFSASRSLLPPLWPPPLTHSSHPFSEILIMDSHSILCSAFSSCSHLWWISKPFKSNPCARACVHACVCVCVYTTCHCSIRHCNCVNVWR